MNRDADGSNDADRPQDGEETGGSVEQKRRRALFCEDVRSQDRRASGRRPDKAGQRFCRRKFVRTYVSDIYVLT